MPTDQLSRRSVVAPAHIADGVLSVLAGANVDGVAADLGIGATDLREAIVVYQEAGRTALAADAIRRDWYQVHVEFPKWDTAESVAVAHIDGPLRHLADIGLISAWWFIRKAPCWRLRLKPAANGCAVPAAVAALLNDLTVVGVLAGWHRTLYEPETAAFGGRPGIDVAHTLFCADSSAVMAYVGTSAPAIGRRELSVLLCTALFRAAGQEWFECGDVWHRVAQMRPNPDNVPIERLTELTESLHDLLAYDSRPTGPLFNPAGPLSFAAPWVTAFEQAGRDLRAAADAGTLERGTRDILAYHVIFHWNRLGLPTTTQSIIANAAESVVLGTGAFRESISAAGAASDL